MHPSTLAKRVFFLLLLAVIAFYVYGLGLMPLVGPDEPRYAQVAHEMFLRRDLITPTLGGHTWFEKPALLYWMMIGAFKVFGVNEWAARFGPAICGLLTTVAVWLLGRHVERSTSSSEVNDLGFWSALVAASSLGLIVFSRGASFDIVITMTMALALSLFMRSELASDDRKQIGFLVGFYCFVGLSLIAKGLVGFVIPFGVIGLYYLLRRTWPNRTSWLSLFWGFPIAVAVSAIWYGPVIYKHGWVFIDEFFVQHHFNRYVSNKYHHPQPVYFYPAILLMLLVPWSPLLVDALIRAKNWRWRDNDSSNRLLVFALAWILFPIVFFSFSGSKLPGYILPIVPAAALLIGDRVSRFLGTQGSPWSLKTTGVLCILMGLIGFVYAVRFERLSLGCSLFGAMPFVLAGALVLPEAFIGNVDNRDCRSCHGGRRSQLCSADCSQRESTRDLLRLADLRGYSEVPVLALRGDDRSAEFYASGRVVYGTNGEVTSLDEVPVMIAEVRQRGERILAFIPSESIDRFSGLPGIEVIGDNGKLALLCFY